MTVRLLFLPVLFDSSSGMRLHVTHVWAGLYEVCSRKGPLPASHSQGPSSTLACKAQKDSLDVQRYAQSSLFKRTVLEFIAEEMLESRAAANPPDAPGGVCRITAGATPVVTSPTDSSMQYLYDHLGLGQTDVADIHDISSGLQRLGESTVTFSSTFLSPLPCQ